jgi:hypothetical protein
MLFVETAYILICALLSFVNAKVIKEDRHIFHPINGAGHILSAIAVGWFYGFWAGVCILLIARLFFDSLLSLSRGLPLDYVSDNPSSLLDRAEKRVFGEDGLTPKLLYLWTLILLNILPYVSL